MLDNQLPEVYMIIKAMLWTRLDYTQASIFCFCFSADHSIGIRQGIYQFAEIIYLDNISPSQIL